ncbi:MAG: carbamoyl phosphate synthase large subunit, partial [Bryobacteraceae bacterium]
GQSLQDLGLAHTPIQHFGVKEAVFPFNMMPEVDPLLGPEMRSTGEVLGLAASFDKAFFKAQEATQSPLPLDGTVLITVARRDREGVLEVARRFSELGMKILATQGTSQWLADHGISSKVVNKMHEGRPHIVDHIVNREIQLIVNTPAGTESELDDSYIRKNAIKYRIPYITTTAGALAAAKGIAACRENGTGEVRSLHSYHAGLETPERT